MFGYFLLMYRWIGLQRTYCIACTTTIFGDLWWFRFSLRGLALTLSFWWSRWVLLNVLADRFLSVEFRDWLYGILFLPLHRTFSDISSSVCQNPHIAFSHRPTVLISIFSFQCPVRLTIEWTNFLSLLRKSHGKLPPSFRFLFRSSLVGGSNLLFWPFHQLFHSPWWPHLPIVCLIILM